MCCISSTEIGTYDRADGDEQSSYSALAGLTGFPGSTGFSGPDCSAAILDTLQRCYRQADSGVSLKGQLSDSICCVALTLPN
jgi:hypothetical protein